MEKTGHCKKAKSLILTFIFKCLVSVGIQNKFEIAQSQSNLLFASSEMHHLTNDFSFGFLVQRDF